MDVVNKLPIIYENKDEIVVSPLIDDPTIYLPVNRRHHKRHYFYTSYNFSNNPNYIKKEEGLIEHRTTRKIVYVPSQKEILLYDVVSFSEEAFLNHNELEKIVVCAEHNEELDYWSLHYSIREYYFSKEYKYRITPLIVVLPVNMEAVIRKSKRACDLLVYLNADPNKRDLVIIFQDVKEPDIYVE